MVVLNDGNSRLWFSRNRFSLEYWSLFVNERIGGWWDRKLEER